METSLARPTQYHKVVQFLSFLLNSFPRTQTSWHPEQPWKQKHLVTGWEPSWAPNKEGTTTECVTRTRNPLPSQYLYLSAPKDLKTLPAWRSSCGCPLWPFKAADGIGYVLLDEGRRRLDLSPSQGQKRTPTLSLASLYAEEASWQGLQAGPGSRFCNSGFCRGRGERNVLSPIIH